MQGTSLQLSDSNPQHRTTLHLKWDDPCKIHEFNAKVSPMHGIAPEDSSNKTNITFKH